jgi:hypothetical protein
MIDNESVQRFLLAKGAYQGSVDGDYGTDSRAAARQVIAGAAPAYKRSWSDTRVRLAVEQLMMTELDIDVGEIDGVEGAMTQFGWEQWQNRMRRRVTRPGAGASCFCHQREAPSFFGAPGTNQVRVTPPYQLYYGEAPVRSVLINKHCADSALRAMDAVLARYGAADIHAMGLDRFGGCYANRAMRGGTQLSMHAFACAIDWDPERNPLRADHRWAQFARPEYQAFLDAWEAEGWTSLGRAKDFDWMHVQAAHL